MSLSKPPGTILIVDDSPTNVGILFDLLEAGGFDVRVAQDGESGLEKVACETPDLILLDVMMPGISGFETCKRLKASLQWADIPIIFMTALADPVDRRRGLQLGAVDYITKPFDQTEVMARVRLHLNLYRVTQELRKEVCIRTAAEAALQQLNQELEQRVEERTDAFKKALSQLRKTHYELSQHKQQLQYEALHDALTGLPNRAWFRRRLQELIERSQADSTYHYAVLFVDLDRFKMVNDSLGHLVGDQVLIQVSERLGNCLRDRDSAARIGGDEFVILIDGMQHVDEAIPIAEKILQQMDRPFHVLRYHLQIGASIGIAPSHFGCNEPDEVLRDADVAVYRAKQAGRGCYVLLTPEMRQQALLRMQLESELRLALERQEFFLVYQPIVSLQNIQPLGFEALARWQNPQRGLIPPGLFIPIAEETGLIRELGWWVLETGLKQLQMWSERFGDNETKFMTINLSPVQLLDETLPQKLADRLAYYALPHSRLKLEITESCILDAQSPAAQTIAQIKNLGIQLCIDDFGTGYSALSRLHEFPMDTLKIDKSFVWRLNDGDGAIVQTIIALAHHLGMNVVAEGIETQAQCQQLQRMGCELGQGYWFSRPLPVREVERRLVILSGRKTLIPVSQL
ncbi:MAG: EAL domain-containing protein [Chloroflexaceae bacterium]|nr:EAL domain-containing protein [Chloroflexaceae bacterium]